MNLLQRWRDFPLRTVALLRTFLKSINFTMIADYLRESSECKIHVEMLLGALLLSLATQYKGTYLYKEKLFDAKLEKCFKMIDLECI